MARGRTCRSARAALADQLVEDFDRVTVLQEVRAADLLTVEPGRTAPDSRTCATGAEVMVDRVRDVEHRRGRVQRDACSCDDLPAFGGPTSAICAAPSR